MRTAAILIRYVVFDPSPLRPGAEHQPAHTRESQTQRLQGEWSFWQATGSGRSHRARIAKLHRSVNRRLGPAYTRDKRAWTAGSPGS